MPRNDEKGYNGWANYATWRVMLEMFDGYDTETPVTAEYCEELADDIVSNYGQTHSGLALDYARAFLSNVDWREIANAINEANDLTPEED
jgi:spore cortex formation protein SpoVR/YcgB (stage V sporulation)